MSSASLEVLGRELAALHRLGDPEDHRDRRAELVADAADQLLAVRGALEQRFLGHLELAGPASLAIERVGQLLDHDGVTSGDSSAPPLTASRTA